MPFNTYPDLNEILQVSGYLFWNPSALDVEANWGTLLGFCEQGVHFEPGYNVVEIKEEEWGEEVRKKIFIGADPKVTVVLKTWNQTMISALFPGLSDALSVKAPGTVKSGLDMSSATYSKPLLFVPEDRTNNPCLLIQKACPNIAATARIKFSHTNKALFPCVFDGLRKSNDTDGISYMGLLSGATLR